MTPISRVEPEQILADARKAELEDVIVIGRTRQGREWYATSTSSGPEVLWLIERLKFILLKD